MNYAMLLPLLERLLASGKFDALLGDKADLLKGLSAGQSDPHTRAIQALTVLAEVSPKDPARAVAFGDAAGELLRALAKLKAALE
mgnify:FL=1